MTPPSDTTHIRGKYLLNNSNNSSNHNHKNVEMEDHSTSSRYEDMVKEEFDVLRSDSNMNLQPLPTSSWRLALQRLLQTGCAHLQAQWRVILAGQVLSFFTAATGAAQATLSFDCHLSAPSLMLGLCYAVLSLTLLYLIHNEQQQQQQQRTSAGKSMPTLETTLGHDEASLQGTLTTPSTAKYRFLGIIPLQAHPLHYVPMAILDVYANYFTILAFKYTTITSVTLFDALAIPSSMILSYCFLHRHYSPVHLVRCWIFF